MRKGESGVCRALGADTIQEARPLHTLRSSEAAPTVLSGVRSGEQLWSHTASIVSCTATADAYRLLGTTTPALITKVEHVNR